MLYTLGCCFLNRICYVCIKILKPVIAHCISVFKLLMGPIVGFKMGRFSVLILFDHKVTVKPLKDTFGEEGGKFFACLVKYRPSRAYSN